MTHQQVIELVEKYLADNDSVTTDELKRTYDISYDTAYGLNAAPESVDDAAYSAYRSAVCYASNRPVSGAAYAANAANYVKQYHKQTTGTVK